MKKIVVSLLLVLAAIPLVSVLALTLKIASPAPESSPWDDALKSLAQQWQSISKGKIEMKVYAGGIVGSDEDVIRKMRIGQVQGAVLTNVGMSEIAPELMALSMPMLIENEAELDYILAKYTPYFENLMKKKGFTVLAWAKAGWIYFYTKEPVVYPKDLKKFKLAVSTGDAQMLQAWRVMGFNAIPLDTKDLMTSLQSGMVEAYYSSPIAVASYQLFTVTPHMNEVKIAPLVGGMVVRNQTWNQIAQKDRAELIDAAHKMTQSLNGKTQELETKAMQVMQKHGLKITQIPAKAQQSWRQESEKGYQVYVGKTFPKKLFDSLNKDLQTFRTNKK